MFVKFTAYFLTNSTAILTDALESIINVVASGFAFYSVYLASLPRDFEHPYGHGKIEFFSAGFEGSLIITAALIIIWQAVIGLFYPKPLERLDVGLYLVALSMLINGTVGIMLQKFGKKYDSLTLIADGKHLFSDAISSLLLIIGIGIIILTKQPWLDSVISLLFASLLLKEGYVLVRKSIAGLMDELNPQSVKEVLNILVQKKKPHWIDVHNLRVQHYGANWHIDCHLTLPYYLDLRQTHTEVEYFREILVNYTGKEVEIFVHIDPCLPPENCQACSYQDCPVRERPYLKSPEWTVENLVKDIKHFRKT